MSAPSPFLFIHDEGALDLSEPSEEHGDTSPLWTGVTTPMASDDFSRILDNSSWFDCPGGGLVIPRPPGAAVEVRVVGGDGENQDHRG